MSPYRKREPIFPPPAKSILAIGLGVLLFVVATLAIIVTWERVDPIRPMGAWRSGR